MINWKMESRLGGILSILTIFNIQTCFAQICVMVAGYEQRYQGDVLQCTVTNATQYDEISTDTEALWIVYPEDNSIQLTIEDTLPSLPDLRLLITDITYLNDTDFEPGAFTNANMPLLETYIITRDINAPPNQNRVFLVLDDSFVGLGHLQNLYLESLALYELQTNSLRELDNLDTLSVKENYLTYILPNTFSNTPALTSLSLHNNYIATLDNDAFIGLENLSQLDLSLNSFSTLAAGPLSHLQNLEILDLSNNEISEIETGTFNGLSVLHYLAMNSNDLSEISMDIFQPLVNLQSLILDSNTIQLTSNMFSHLTSLRHVSLSNNGITRIEASHFTGLENLTELFLSNNLLDTIQDDTFSGVPSLTSLDLAENLIETIELNAFRGLNNLVRISLEANMLTSLPDGAFEPFVSLDTIYLHDNTWFCDCDIQWLIVWVRARYASLEPSQQWSQIICGSDDPIADYTFYALINQQNILASFCGLSTGTSSVDMETTGISIIAQSTTVRTRSTTEKPRRYDNDALQDRDKIILSVCLIFVALIAVIVIIYLVHLKQRKNRIWEPPDEKEEEQQRSELATKSQNSVPSFYPDPDSGHGSSTWEIQETDHEASGSVKNVAEAHPQKGALQRQLSYVNQGMEPERSETLNSADKQDTFRSRRNSMASAHSMYSIEGEYYKDGYDKGYNADGAEITSVTAMGTPARVRTIGVSSMDQKSRDTNSQDPSHNGTHYAKIGGAQSNDASNSGNQSYQSTSAGSGDHLLPPDNSTLSSHSVRSLLRTDTSSQDNGLTDVMELTRLPSPQVNAKTVLHKLKEDSNLSTYPESNGDIHKSTEHSSEPPATTGRPSSFNPKRHSTDLTEIGRNKEQDISHVKDVAL